jgi:hypothetical protein
MLATLTAVAGFPSGELVVSLSDQNLTTTWKGSIVLI